MQISQSDVVRVRGARWRVAAIREYGPCRLLTLEGMEPGNSTLIRRVLAPFDRLDRIERRRRPTNVARGIWRRAFRALVAADTPPGSLRSALRARLDLLPHQLE